MCKFQLCHQIRSVIKDKPFIAAEIFITKKIKSHLVQTSNVFSVCTIATM